jgi:hypothetical protein
MVLRRTNGIPSNPIGLFWNQSHARRGVWPLRNPYFTARSASLSFRYSSIARSRFARSAPHLVTTSPSTHDRMSALESSPGGLTSDVFDGEAAESGGASVGGWLHPTAVATRIAARIGRPAVDTRLPYHRGRSVA